MKHYKVTSIVFPSENTMELESIFDVILRRHRQNHNLSSSEEREIMYKNFLEEDFNLSLVYLLIIGIGIVAGIIGNILIIGGVSVYHRLRTSGNVFIVNLAVADLIVVTIVQPFNMIGILIGPQFYHGKLEALCHMVATLCTMSCACSMMSLAAVALNRYIFVCKNLVYNTVYTKKKTCVYICLIWITVSLVDLPNYLAWSAHTFDYKTMGCVVDRHYYGYTMSVSTLIYWIPLALIVFCYVSIYLHVRKQRRSFCDQMTKCSSANDQIMVARQKQDIRMIRTFVLVIIIFVFCWVPYFGLVLFDTNEHATKIQYVVSLAIGHCNSSINSIVYGASNERFRRGYKMFLRNYICKCCKKGSNKTPTGKRKIYMSSNHTGLTASSLYE